MKISKYSTIFFDLDGTLLNSADAIFSSVIHTCRYFGIEPLNRVDIESRIGLPATNLFNEDLGIELVNDCVSYFRMLLNEYSFNQHHLFDGVIPLLWSLSEKGVRMAIVSNKPTQLSLDCLKKTQIDKFFSDVYGSDLYEHKPSPQMLIAAIGSTPREHCLMVGDRVEDLLSAQAAGVDFLGIGESLWREKEPLMGDGVYICKDLTSVVTRMD